MRLERTFLPPFAAPLILRVHVPLWLDNATPFSLAYFLTPLENKESTEAPAEEKEGFTHVAKVQHIRHAAGGERQSLLFSEGLVILLYGDSVAGYNEEYQLQTGLVLFEHGLQLYDMQQDHMLEYSESRHSVPHVGLLQANVLCKLKRVHACTTP